MKLHNTYKLFTREDPLHIHKILGTICLLHYGYRYYLLLTTGTMDLHSDSAYVMVGIHGLLSVSSMIFHIPYNRIRSAPMIYPEYRLHSIIFALRSVICYYLTYYNLSKTYHGITCVITMIGADIVTNLYPSGTTTMRQMPFDNTIDEDTQHKIIVMQSTHQIGATLFMFGNADSCFSPMFAIQFAALLMTLVRKSIITTVQWHILYNMSLAINILCYYSVPMHFITAKLIFANVFYYWRFTSNRNNLIIGNKYIGWICIILVMKYYNWSQVFGDPSPLTRILFYIPVLEKYGELFARRFLIFGYFAFYQFYVHRKFIL
jgi:hypothetical protein